MEECWFQDNIKKCYFKTCPINKAGVDCPIYKSNLAQCILCSRHNTPGTGWLDFNEFGYDFCLYCIDNYIQYSIEDRIKLISDCLFYK